MAISQGLGHIITMGRSIVLVLIVTSAMPHANLLAEPPNTLLVARNRPTLGDQLKNGLRATRPYEIAYLDRVVALVENGDLPLALVQSTFQWARRRNPSYPFPYFQFALRLRAEKIGVTI